MKSNTVLLLAILFLSFAIRFAGIFQGLPYWNHSDEFHTIARALQFGTGDLDPHNYDWPGHILMYFMFFVYGVYFVFGSIFGFFNSSLDFAFLFLDNPSSFLFLGRLITVVIGTASVYLLYVCGKKFYNENTGLASALIFSVVLLHVKQSQWIVPHAFAVFLMIWTVIVSHDILYKKSAKFYVYAGILCGLAIAMIYNSGLIVFVPVLAHLLAERKIKALFDKKIFYFLLAVVVAFLVATPFFVINFDIAVNDAVVKIFTFTNKKAVFGEGYLLLFTKYLREAFGVIPYLLSLFGLGFLLYRHKKQDLLLASFPLINFVVLGLNQVPMPRYLLPVLPFLILGGVVFLHDFLFRGKKYVAFSVLIFLLAVPSAVQSVNYDIYINRKSTELIAKDWVEANIPAGTRIAMESGIPLTPNKESLLFKHVWTASRAPETIAHYKEILAKKPYPEKTYFLIDIWPLMEHSPDGFHPYEADTNPFPELLRLNVSHVIVDSRVERNVLESFDEVLTTLTGRRKEYRDDVERFGIKVFEINESYYRSGPDIRIYEVDYSAAGKKYKSSISPSQQ